jgi:hypothetical protein
MLLLFGNEGNLSMAKLPASGNYDSAPAAGGGPAGKVLFELFNWLYPVVFSI